MENRELLLPGDVLLLVPKNGEKHLLCNLVGGIEKNGKECLIVSPVHIIPMDDLKGITMICRNDSVRTNSTP